MNALSKNPIPVLFEEISREGFKTTWMHPVFHSFITEKGKAKEEFYVSDLPVSKIAPFDTAETLITLKGDRIHCCIKFYFSQAFQDCTSQEEFTKAMDEKEPLWLEAFHECFGNISDYFGLAWEIEANTPASEDEAYEMTFSLEGSFEAAGYTRVRTLLLEIRERDAV